MAHLKIQNVGPLKHVDIDLNKVNVIIGPQSSGKSTISKIACYCSWVEKRVCLLQSFDYFMSGHTLYDELVRFHKLEGFFGEDSDFEYESNAIRLHYLHRKGIPEFSWIDRYACKRNKIGYIPSERSLVAAISNWFEVKFADNIRNFMIDWEDARKLHSREKAFPIPGLNVCYYYEGATGKDKVVIEDNKVLDLTNTSSGLQSLIPLEVVLKYLVSDIYNRNNISSVNEDRNIRALLRKLYTDMPEGEARDRKASEFKYIQYSKLFIEEPELNIFPETQCAVLYHLLGLIKMKDEHSLFLTTHSHYILYALNNCIMGYLVKDEMPVEEQKELKSPDAWIDPKLVSAYEITGEGTLKSIQNEKTGTIGKHYFNRVMNGMMDEYYDMLAYLKNDRNEK